MIYVLSASNCKDCKKAKQYLDEKKVSYCIIPFDLNNFKCEEMLEKSGGLKAPIIQIGDEFLIGFDKNKIDESLKKYRQRYFSPYLL